MSVIAVDITRPDDVHDFRNLTQELHASMRPTQRSYATCGAIGYRPMSREGFLDTALQNVNSPATMAAVAVRSHDRRQNGVPFLECLLVPIRPD